MFKCIREPEFSISCDWCYEERVGVASVPEGWKSVPAELFGGQVGSTHLHWCPECLEKIKKLRVNDRSLVHN